MIEIDDSNLHLSRIEWQAVAIAIQDAATGKSVPRRPPCAARRLYRWLTGLAPLRPLADPRLEAIRSFVSHTRRTRRIDAALTEPLIGAGFNIRQVRALAALTI